MSMIADQATCSGEWAAGWEFMSRAKRCSSHGRASSSRTLDECCRYLWTREGLHDLKLLFFFLSPYSQLGLR